MKLFLLVILVSFLLPSCNDSVSSNYNLAEEFSLKIHNSAFVDDGRLKIYFEAADDSRCPRNVVCTWGGEGKILLKLAINKSDTASIEIILKPGVEKKDTELHSSINYKDYKITFMQLDPYPDTRIRIHPESYRALLKVTKN